MTATGKVRKNVLQEQLNKIMAEVDSDLWESEHYLYS
jgi:hypothetical protein